jgi:hypothetical protein
MTQPRRRTRFSPYRRESRYPRDSRGRFEGGLLQGIGWGCGCFVAFMAVVVAGLMLAMVYA